MNKNRLEAFSDAILAIIITIMVLELKVPKGTDLSSLKPLLPNFLCYVMSFVFLAIYWNNHHHMFYTVKKVTGGILLANTHLLFWLSLTPFVTGWMGENNFAPVPVALYGANMLMAGIAYYILQTLIIRTHGDNSLLSRALGKDFKGKISLILYATAIVSCYFNEWIAGGIYVLVVLIWLVPDRRIERIIYSQSDD